MGVVLLLLVVQGDGTAKKSHRGENGVGVIFFGIDVILSEFECYLHEALEPVVGGVFRVHHEYTGLLVSLPHRVCEVIQTWRLVKLIIKYGLRNRMFVLAVHDAGYELGGNRC